jgi:hypothetical protein
MHLSASKTPFPSLDDVHAGKLIRSGFVSSEK